MDPKSIIAERLLPLIHGSGMILASIAFLVGIAFALYFMHVLLSTTKQSGMGTTQYPAVTLTTTFFAFALLIRFGASLIMLQDTFVPDSSYPGAGIPTEWRVSDSFDSSSSVILQATLVRDLFMLFGAIGVFRAIIMLPRFGNHTFGVEPPTVGRFLAFLLGGIAMLRVSDVAAGLAWAIPMFQGVSDLLSKAV